MKAKKKTVGIVGGMGPMATVDLFRRIVALTEAHTDADHIRILIDNRPEIPDRTAAILAGEDTPVRYIVESARRLAAIGADFIAVPCNTSHHFYDRIASLCPIPVVNMIEETARALQKNGVHTAAVLATDGALRVGVYSHVLARHGIRTLIPDIEGQARVTHLIYGEIKAGMPPHPERLFADRAALAARGAEAAILGCTELPLAFAGVTCPLPLYDPTDILARAVITRAGYKVRTVSPLALLSL